jgi:hypothetical protein
MEANNQRRARGLRDKIPDIQKTLDTVQFLQKRDVSSKLPCRKWLAGAIFAPPFSSGYHDGGP